MQTCRNAVRRKIGFHWFIARTHNLNGETLVSEHMEWPWKVGVRGFEGVALKKKEKSINVLSGLGKEGNNTVVAAP